MDWRSRLRRILAEASEGGQVIFIGIGNPLRGDDGIGVKIAEDLKALLRRGGVEVMVIEDRVDLIPKVLENRNVSLIIFFDAADFGGKPGEIRMMSVSESSGKTLSTHDLPIELMLKISGTNAPAYVIGIQATAIKFGEEIRPQVVEAGKAIVRFLVKEFSSK